MNCFCCFLQRKACFTELAILETLICTKERRGLALQAAPSCPRSQLHYTVEAAFIIKSKFLDIFLISEHSLSWLTACFISFHKVNIFFSVFFFLSPGFQNQHKRLLAVNRWALTIWRLKMTQQATQTNQHQSASNWPHELVETVSVEFYYVKWKYNVNIIFWNGKAT